VLIRVSSDLIRVPLWEIDYQALRQFIEQAFVEHYGTAEILDVRVAHFNPDVIDVTVTVSARQPEMDGTVLQLNDALRREGLRVGIRVTQAPETGATSRPG
jgi:hypothetical protein